MVAENFIPEILVNFVLRTYEGASVAMPRYLDWNTCSFLIWLRAAVLKLGHVYFTTGRMTCV